MTRPNCSRAAGLIVVAALAVGLLPVDALADEPPTPVAITMDMTANPVSGSKFSFDPAYPDGFVIPEDGICQYELRWGDDGSLLRNEWNDTFGSTIVRGTKAAGYCDGWDFTLPYSIARQWQWDYTVTDNDSNPLIERPWTGEDYPIFTGANGVPDGSGIAESTIPGVWLTMTKHVSVGSTITVQAHPYGGYVMPPDGASWAAYAPGDDSEYHVAMSHSLTFTFIPHTVGNWSSFYNDAGDPNFAGAGVDPMVTASKTRQSVRISLDRTVHLKHFVPFKVNATAFKGSVTCWISVNHERLLNGCAGRLVFSRAGKRTVTATVTDRHGHRATRTVTISVTR